MTDTTHTFSPSLVAAARELVQQADANALPTTVHPGFTEPIVVHILQAMSFTEGHRPKVYAAGETVTVTPEMVSGGKWISRDGTNVFLDRLAAGHHFARGVWPAWRRTFVYGTHAWYAAHTTAVNRARATNDVGERERLLAEARRYYGPGGTSPADFATFYDEQYFERRAWEAEQSEAATAGGSR